LAKLPYLTKLLGKLLLSFWARLPLKPDYPQRRRRYRDKEDEKNGKKDHKVPKHNKQIEKNNSKKRF